MVDYANDYNYANSRLSNSAVECNGRILWVRGVNMDGSVLANYLDGSQAYGVMLKDLNNNNIPLGFVNYFDEAVFVTRIPKKQWKQGLTEGNLYNLTNGGGFYPKEQCLDNVIANRYPSVEMCLESVETGEAMSMAFCRNYAIGAKQLKGYELLYKGYGPVGVIHKSDEGVLRFELNEKHTYLQEDLEEIWEKENV